MTNRYIPKLIEVALPLAAINAESGKQKTMGAAPHPQNLHRWWARRPLASTRAVLWAALVDDPSGHPDRFPSPEDQQLERERLLGILARLVPWSASGDADVLAEARREIDRCFDGALPPILDPFAGGGAIPIEAQRLGIEALAGDLNPVAILIQRSMLEIAPVFAGRPPVHSDASRNLNSWPGSLGLAADVDAYGRQLGARAEERIGDLYPAPLGPSGEALTPLAWIWARTVESPDPSWPGHVPLVRSWTLSKKAGAKAVWVEAVVGGPRDPITYVVREGGTPPDGNVDRSGATCIATGVPIPFSYIRDQGRKKRMGVDLIAVVAEGPSGRRYVSPSAGDRAHLSEIETSLRLGPIPDNPRDFKTPNYGMTEWEDLFTDRQLTALETFSAELASMHKLVRADAVRCGFEDDGVRLRDRGRGATAYADAVVTYLALAVDRCADYWSSICSWHAPNAQIRETFARQAIPMTWDFAEANPFSGRMASWASMLKTVVRAIPTLPTSTQGSTEQRDARARVRETGTCIISTDPPYYDNISYADLSDFFFVWLRRNLADIWPDECATLLTPKSDELIANPYRAGSKEAAFEHFESGMADFFSELASAQDPRVPATIFYAFKQIEEEKGGRSSTGWETFLQGLLNAGLAVTATWPMRTEMVTKIGAKNNMLASSIVLACRPKPTDAALETRGGFVAALRSELPEAVRLLQQENIAPVDLAQSAIGPGMRIFSRYTRVVEADGSEMTVRAALALINEVLGEVLSEEEAELDADSRFALTWFDQFAYNSGPYGDADVLSRAKDTSVAGVVEAGIAEARSNRLRLLERGEMDAGWSPIGDRRATVWEATQHLVRRLGESESNAAELLAELGGVADRARQLAYLLYGVCERRSWSDEATAYNSLITAWPELQRLAISRGDSEAQQKLL